MASFSRGVLGLTHHSFACGIYRSQQTVCGSSSPVLAALQLRLARPPICSKFRSFSSSTSVRGKGPQRGKALKNATTAARTQRASTPSQPPPAPSPPPKSIIKPRTTPAAIFAPGAPRPASAPVPTATTASSSTVSAVPAPAGYVSSFAEQLGRRTASTLLYEAPSHFWFRATTLTAGLLTIAYTVANYYSVFLYPPENLVWWVPHAFAVICGVMIAGGTYFLTGGLGIIRVIHAIPSARIAEIAGKGAAATAARAVKDAGGGPMPPIFLELEIGRVLPFLPARKRYILPENLVVPFRFASYGLSGDVVPVAGAAGVAAATGSPLTGYERVKAHEAEQERVAKLREYEMDHLMTAPFRHAGQGAQSAWSQIQRAFSREGFLPVFVNGDRQKLDVMGGWALENGRALDRLVTVKNDIK
ncbi:hypothetical protein SEPCBS57363_000095 [Sporothrix epigloea]|uniref:Uncharacterized protein n=1 Tax=Sporothrix epigloea TaxID=1892477 RepID=A0ABP0D2S3_9PEZI